MSFNELTSYVLEGFCNQYMNIKIVFMQQSYATLLAWASFQEFEV